MQKHKNNIAITSLISALTVGLINTVSALALYHSFIVKKPLAANTSLISTNVQSDSSQPQSVAVSSSSGGGLSGGASAGLTKSGQPVATSLRKADAPIAIGQAPQPASTSIDSSGQIVYHWCSGANPNLEDGVCEAVLSIASDPSSNNPHLSDQAKQSLSLLPKDSTLTMDESSWNPSSTTAGTMLVTLHTKVYGDVKLKISLEKINNIWIVTDGQLT